MPTAVPYRTRFAPSPTGSLHVGNARTALFDYLLARQSGGQFILRIEDTDRRRHQEQAVDSIVEDLRWLGLQWDEGVAIGGPHGPYLQSQRLDIYQDVINKLIGQGNAYYAFDTPQELEAMRQQAVARKESFRYVRPADFPTRSDADRARASGRPVVVRFVCPKKDVTVIDDAFGPVTMPSAEMEDFIIQKDDGYPTYYLANAVDDALMEINYIVRGQEFLGQTWRQVLLREALGYVEPRYLHLPMVMDMQGRKLSKRDGAVEVRAFRQEGYLPEVLVNFLALLGWGPGQNREKLTLSEMVELFSVERIGKTNAKFDRDKLLAFNTDACAAASPERLLACFKDYLSLNETPFPRGDDKMLAHLLAICHGFRTFRDVVTKAGVLFVADDAYEFDPKAVEKVLKKGDGLAVLAEVRAMLAGQTDFSREAIQKALDDFAAAKGLGMGKVAQPIRVAVTGTTISPGMAETLEILGRQKTLARIDRCLSLG